MSFETGIKQFCSNPSCAHYFCGLLTKLVTHNFFCTQPYCEEHFLDAKSFFSYNSVFDIILLFICSYNTSLSLFVRVRVNVCVWEWGIFC